MRSFYHDAKKRVRSSVSEHPRFLKSRKELLRDRLYDLKKKYVRFLDKILQFQPIPSCSWASWSASLRENIDKGKKKKTQLIRDYSGQGYKLKLGPEFTADQLQRNAGGVQKVILKNKRAMMALYRSTG